MLCGVGADNREFGTRDAVSRCGLPFEGEGRPIRDIGARRRVAFGRSLGARVKVTWAPRVEWAVPIRLAKP